MQALFTPYKKPESGKLLLSEPFLKDAYFSRSVILLAEHNEEGSYGLIINKPTHLSISELIEDFPAFDAPIYLGGPVNPNSVFYLHSLGNEIENCIKVSDNLFFGGDIEQIKELILINRIKPSDIKFYSGYSGWVPKQLDRELKEKSWVVVDYQNINFLENTPQVLWNNILKKMGKEYAYWAISPIDPQLN